VLQENSVLCMVYIPIITICKIISMIMDGDVPIDLSKPSFRGTGNKISKITKDYVHIIKILYIVNIYT